MRNNMITKKLIKFALLFFLIGLTACDNKLNPGFDPDDYEPIVPPEPVRTMDAMASGERVVLSGASLRTNLCATTSGTYHDSRF